MQSLSEGTIFLGIVVTFILGFALGVHAGKASLTHEIEKLQYKLALAQKRYDDLVNRLQARIQERVGKK